jgi:hypothetical protein
MVLWQSPLAKIDLFWYIFLYAFPSSLDQTKDLPWGPAMVVCDPRGGIVTLLQSQRPSPVVEVSQLHLYRPLGFFAECYESD